MHAYCACLAGQCRYENIVASTHLTPPVFRGGGGGGGGGGEEQVLLLLLLLLLLLCFTVQKHRGEEQIHEG